MQCSVIWKSFAPSPEHWKGMVAGATVKVASLTLCFSDCLLEEKAKVAKAKVLANRMTRTGRKVSAGKHETPGPAMTQTATLTMIHNALLKREKQGRNG